MMLSLCSRIAVRRLPIMAATATTVQCQQLAFFSTPVAMSTDASSPIADIVDIAAAPPLLNLESLLLQTYPGLLEKQAADDTDSDTNYTPGHVLAVLNQVGKGGVELHEEHFRFLLHTARSNETKDATVLLTALVNYKRINRFLLSEELATDCIDSILRTSDPMTGGLLLLEHMTPESGLYYATSLDNVHKILRHVLHESTVIDDEPPERVWGALTSFWKQLMTRYSRPDRNMKKRAKRRYLKQLQITYHEGPTQETVDLAVELGLSIKSDDPEEVYQTIVQPCVESPRRIALDMNEEGSILQALSEKRMAQQHNKVEEDDLSI